MHNTRHLKSGEIKMNHEMKSDLVDIRGTLLEEDRPKAILFKSFNAPEACWLPKSQIEYYDQGGICNVTMPEWLAIEKKLV